MTDNLPDYTAIEPPANTPPAEYTTHERRAAVLRAVIEAGSPFAINQAALAECFDVHRSTISRDMDRLRESIEIHLAQDAKLTTRALFESIVADLLDEDDWRAKKAAWDMVMDWNEWLADLGEQHREPRRSEMGVDVRSRNLDVAYTVVRAGEDEPLPTTREGMPDYDAMGFSSGPTGIEANEGRADE